MGYKYHVINVFDKYVIKILAVATFVTALSLTLIILLTQSIRYLELVISSDASPFYFLVMISLAIPKFLEAIMPLAFAIGSIYTANRLMNDREMIIMSAAGASVTTLGRPFMMFAGFMMVFQFVLSGWIAPMAVERLQITRAEVKSHYATLIFREGVFNTLSNGLTAYVENRNGMNEIENIMIHDAKGRLNEGQSTTILAKRGIINLTENRQQLLIYDGTQYLRNIEKGTLSRLDFNQYTLDIPTEESSIATRWKEPDERIFTKLFISDSGGSARDIGKKKEFIAEIHRRIATPLLYGSFIISIIIFIFMGSWNRRNMSAPLFKSGIVITVTQALFIVAYNEARDITLISYALYFIAGAPLIFGFWRLYDFQKEKV